MKLVALDSLYSCTVDLFAPFEIIVVVHNSDIGFYFAHVKPYFILLIAQCFESTTLPTISAHFVTLV
jgi:hypothetical protein